MNACQDQPALTIDTKRRQMYYQQGYWTERTFLDRWNESVQHFGGREFLVDNRGNRYTYFQMDTLATRLAAALHTLHVQPGNRVAIQCPNWSEFVILTLACYKAGAVPSPLSSNFGFSELCMIFLRTKPVTYFCPTVHRGRNYLPLIEQVHNRFPQIQTVLLDNEAPAPTGTLTLGKLLQAPAKYAKISAAASSDDLALVIHTSGTTGAHKCAMHTHNTMLFTEDSYRTEYHITENDVMFMPSSLCYATGFMHGIVLPALAGAKVVLQEKFSPKAAAELIRREGCTFSHGATPFVYDLISQMESSGERLPSMRFYACGGASVPNGLIRRGAAVGLRVCECYGSTESPCHVGVRQEEWSGEMEPSAGRPMPAVEVKLIDAAGHRVSQGQCGEECCRGPQVFVGYMNDPEATGRALDAESWCHSGDLCSMDSAGRLRVVCRIKDIILRGGLNLDANFLNAQLIPCPEVLDSTVIGAPDERLGERICAYIVPRNPEQPITLVQLQTYLRQHGVPKYCWPERLEYIAAIPLTESGKVDKRRLRENLMGRMNSVLHPCGDYGGNK